MKKRLLAKILPLTCGLILAACSDDDAPFVPSADPGPSTSLTLTPIMNLNQGPVQPGSHMDEWEHSSLMPDYRAQYDVPEAVTGGTNSYYPRLKQMKNGKYILFYQHNPQAADTRYAITENFIDWEPWQFLHQRTPITNALGNADQRYYTTTDAIVLDNGDIITATSYRANKGYARTPTDNGIMVRRSTDNGKTWSEELPVYQGTNWEPAFTKRSNGRIEIYFSQSRPEVAGSHSGTAMLWSDDNGVTWKPDFGQPAHTVIRHKWFDPNAANAMRWTDQMPCIIELVGSGNLFAVTESRNPNDKNGENFNIALAWAGADGFPHITGIDEEGPTDRAINIWQGASPWVVQAPSGEVVARYNRKSITQCRLGSPDARQWDEEMTILPDYKGSWGCNYLETPHSVIFSNPGSGGKFGIARCILNHAINATGRHIGVDADNSEWANTDDAIFAGSKCQAQATLRCSADDENIYFLVEVLDEHISPDDYVNILLSPVTTSGNINSDARRIKVAYYGLKSTDIYAGGWVEHAMNVTVATSHDGSIGNNEDTDHGWLAEVAVPRSEIGVSDGRLLVNLVLFTTEGGEDATAPTTVKSLRKWVPILGL